MLRQLILIHESGLSDEEREEYKRAIFTTIRNNFERLVSAIKVNGLLDSVAVTGIEVL